MTSLSRFYTTFAKELRETRRTIAMQILVMVGAMCFLTLFIVFNNYDDYSDRFYTNGVDPLWNNMFALFAWSLMIFGSLSAANTMKNMSSRQKRISTLMYPASQFEKYFVRWLIYVPLFLVVFAISCFIADLLRYVICIPFVTDKEITLKLLVPFGISEYVNYIEEWKAVNIFFMLFFFVQSLFVLGSSFWPKQTFVKTFIMFSITATIYYFIGYGVYKIFDSGYWYAHIVNNEVHFTPYWCLTICGCAINYALAYWRFRESEIIQRW